MRVAVGGFVSGRPGPVVYVHDPGYSAEHDAQDALVRACGRHVQADLGFHLDHPGGDLDETQAQRVKLRTGKARSFRHRGAQAPHQPVSAGMQEQPELVGRLAGDIRLPT